MSQNSKVEERVYNFLQDAILSVVKQNDRFDEKFCFNEGEPENNLIMSFFDKTKILNQEQIDQKSEYMRRSIGYPVFYTCITGLLFKSGYKRVFNYLVEKEIQGFFKAKKIYESQSNKKASIKYLKKYKNFIGNEHDIDQLKVACKDKLTFRTQSHLIGVTALPACVLHYYGNYIMKNKFRDALMTNYMPIGSFRYLHVGPLDVFDQEKGDCRGLFL